MPPMPSAATWRATGIICSGDSSLLEKSPSTTPVESSTIVKGGYETLPYGTYWQDS